VRDEEAPEHRATLLEPTFRTEALILGHFYR
jgi:hypothetical protein